MLKKLYLKRMLANVTELTVQFMLFVLGLCVFAGNRLVKRLGPNPRDLCTPCEPNTYTDDSSNYRCKRCTQCVGMSADSTDHKLYRTFFSEV